MRVYVLSSGSTGNCAVFEADGQRLVLDAGLNGAQADGAMKRLGGDLFPTGALGIVITHHHGDHIGKAQPLARALRCPLYLHPGVEASRLRRKLEVRAYTIGAPFQVGPFQVDTMLVPHDAPQVAVKVATRTRSFGVATDLGHWRDNLVDFLGSCDGALVEANYCPQMLAFGPYPPRIRARVAGPLGHLANEQTAALAKRLAKTRLARLYLGHVSRSNNTPERALEVVRAEAGTLPVELIDHGHGRVLEVEVGARGPSRHSQLALPFGLESPSLL